LPNFKEKFNGNTQNQGLQNHRIIAINQWKQWDPD